MADLTRFRNVSHRGIAQSPIVISSPDSGDNGLKRRASGPAEGDAIFRRINSLFSSGSEPLQEQEPTGNNEPQVQPDSINKGLPRNSSSISSLSPTPSPEIPPTPWYLWHCDGNTASRAQNIVAEELELKSAGRTVGADLSWGYSRNRRKNVRESASKVCEVLLEDGAFDFFVKECTDEMLRALKASGDPSMEFMSDDYFSWLVDKLLCSELSK